MTCYVTMIDKAWAAARVAAQAQGCSAQQLRALDDLSDEFGPQTNARLKHPDWHFSVDSDGDVVLTFQKLNTSGIEALTTVNIDRDGFMTTTNHISGEVITQNPQPGRYYFLEMRAFALFLVNGIERITHDGVPAAWIRETNEVLTNLFQQPRSTVAFCSGFYDGPLRGYVEIAGKLRYFDTHYEDLVSGVRVYRVYAMSRSNFVNRCYVRWLKLRRWLHGRPFFPEFPPPVPHTEVAVGHLILRG